jgi:hypothetical protein
MRKLRIEGIETRSGDALHPNQTTMKRRLRRRQRWFCTGGGTTIPPFSQKQVDVPLADYIRANPGG